MFHSLQYFWNAQWQVFDICCQKTSTVKPQWSVREVKLNKTEEEVLQDIRSHYTTRRDRLTRLVLLLMRKEYGHVLNGVCCVCLKAGLPKCPTGRKVRFLGIRLSRYTNHHNPPCINLLLMSWCSGV